MVLEGLLYSPSHEWVKVEGNEAYVGISDHAQESLGAVVFIELPKVGATIKKGETFGAVESVKAASDLYLPVTGKVIEVNSTLEDAPETINDDPYGSWILKIELLDDSELEDLLSGKEYETSIEE
ncbi:glycine cleavage system protein GcvH [Peloplasma aerotolerans]|jgi:glycine cleavage system H protein|uniref:Glycine cleavage system H protein n=1 Tax=Peloplasma aerotolerans TaxID=3044389 RepID=A0AAW6U9S1_9MOLU|nr:glycine cleavage system protein GcvH [Mariniplasma sp. M4Ah]MDI6452266.1 glycine cleavage system protein GcvH [Mariniplasma sp. M4Ah]